VRLALESYLRTIRMMRTPMQIANRETGDPVLLLAHFRPSNMMVTRTCDADGKGDEDEEKATRDHHVDLYEVNMQ